MQSMSRLGFSGAAMVVALLVSACGSTSAKPEAEALCSKYFAAVEEGRFRDVLPLYSKEFYTQISEEEWTRMLQGIQEKLGQMEWYKLVGWKVNV